jgi:tetratricopeptide (TPR) repeat protein
LSKASQIRQRAQEYLSKGQIDKAIQEYRRLLSIESKNPNLYNELGDIFLRANDKAQAVQNFEKAATIYERVALYNNAVAVCKKILRIEPEKADTLFKLAELRAKQKLEGDAATFFLQYVECVLANPQGLLQRAQKDVDRMLELLPSSEPIMENAVEVFDQLGLKLKTADLCSKLAAVAKERGDSRKHMQFVRRAQELRSGLSPEEAESTGPDSADSVDSRAVSDLHTEDSDAGTEPEREAGELEHGDTAAAEREASPPADGLTPGEAEEGAPDAASGEPDIDATVRRAVEEAEMVTAISRGQQSSEQSAEDGEGRARSKKRGTRSAQAATEAAPPFSQEGASPGPAASDAASAPPQAGESATEPAVSSDGLAEEITSDVEKDDLRSHYDLGMAYLEMGLYTEAIKDLQIASRCEDLQLSSMEMIGYCFLKHNQPRLAVKQLTRALEIAKKSGAANLGIHYNLGLGHEMLGELDAAREHFEEVYIIDMAFRDVSEKMKKLTTS